MALPTSHGLVVLVGLGAMSLTGDVSGVEFIAAGTCGVLTDTDHMGSGYLKDLVPRIRRGGGVASRDFKFPTCWFHLWPGLILSVVMGIVLHYLDPSFRIYLPFLFWMSHMVVDEFEKQPDWSEHKHFFYPLSIFLIPKEISKKLEIYSPKTFAEVAISCAVYAVITFMLIFLQFPEGQKCLEIGKTILEKII